MKHFIGKSDCAFCFPKIFVRIRNCICHGALLLTKFIKRVDSLLLNKGNCPCHLFQIGDFYLLGISRTHLCFDICLQISYQTEL